MCDFWTGRKKISHLEGKILNNQVGEFLPCRSIIVATKIRGVYTSTEEILLNGMEVLMVSAGR